MNPERKLEMEINIKKTIEVIWKQRKKMGLKVERKVLNSEKVYERKEREMRLRNY